MSRWKRALGALRVRCACLRAAESAASAWVPRSWLAQLGHVAAERGCPEPMRAMEAACMILAEPLRMHGHCSESHATVLSALAWLL